MSNVLRPESTIVGDAYLYRLLFASQNLGTSTPGALGKVLVTFESGIIFMARDEYIHADGSAGLFQSSERDHLLTCKTICLAFGSDGGSVRLPVHVAKYTAVQGTITFTDQTCGDVTLTVVDNIERVIGTVLVTRTTPHFLFVDPYLTAQSA